MTNNSEEFIAYLTHLRAEHRRLREFLREIEQTWTKQDITRPSELESQVIRKLEGVRAELAHHFTEEESGGCLDEAVARQPSLGHEADRLEREHPALLKQLGQLIAQLKAASQAIQSLDDAKEGFRRFSEQLEAHEFAENRILEESFGIEAE
ncbi:MAG: hemerythrin domain-containing protein [Candidatus Paceibacterota bacterium]